jgi:hypothetical protein
MRALLKYAKIDSYYTLVYGDSKPVKIHDSFPSQQFNHVILCVPLDGDSIWLENTSQHLPFNYLGTFTQNRKALIIKRGASHLVTTPALTLPDVAEKSIHHYEIGSNGQGKLNIEVSAKGREFEKLRYIDVHFSASDKDDYFRNEKLIDNSELISYKISQPLSGPTISFQGSYDIFDHLRKVGDMYAIRLAPSINISLENKKSRKNDVLISYPRNQSDSIIYQCPPMLSAMDVELPKDVSISTKFGRYQERYSRAEEQIIASREFQLFQGYYDLNEYSAFYDFIESLHQTQNKSVIILKFQ